MFDILTRHRRTEPNVWPTTDRCIRAQVISFGPTLSYHGREETRSD